VGAELKLGRSGRDNLLQRYKVCGGGQEAEQGDLSCAPPASFGKEKINCGRSAIGLLLSQSCEQRPRKSHDAVCDAQRIDSRGAARRAPRTRNLLLRPPICTRRTWFKARRCCVCACVSREFCPMKVGDERVKNCEQWECVTCKSTAGTFDSACLDCENRRPAGI
jgi:hypothetical protein